MTATKHEHLDLLCDIGELSGLLRDAADIEAFLDHTVGLVARHLEAHVCSIYLFDELTDQLVLQATMGLHPEAVGKVRIPSAEGLVGKALSTLQPVCTGDAGADPAYRYFAETGEERFSSFLAVPIRRGRVRIGVLVVQHEAVDRFDSRDIRALKAAASQLGSAIESARLMLVLGRGDVPDEGISAPVQQLLRGETAARGVAIGPAVIMGTDRSSILRDDAEPEVACGLEVFQAALKKTVADLTALQDRFAERLPESASLIFTAHFMMLKDPSFRKKIEAKVADGASPMAAVRSVARHYIAVFAASPHAYIREKAADMEDLSCRLLRNLRPEVEEGSAPDRRGAIVVATELYPSDILKLVSEDVAGVVLVTGGLTSHVAILSRSLQIPLLIVENPSLLHLSEGTPLLLDGGTGNLYVHPDGAVVETFERSQAAAAVVSEAAQVAPETWTACGKRVRLLANVNLLSEVKLALDVQAEGVGLYRTEFPFLIRPTFPSESEQYRVYKRLFDDMAGKTVTIRTLDVGGDKVLAHADATEELNPELGLRSIRFSLLHRDVFEAQIRAILRAAADCVQPRLMFPMISSPDEFRDAKEIVFSCMEALEREGLRHHKDPAIGMMVELPAAVELIEIFAKESAFFSIGTNDLVQYMLAVDRTNQKVAGYFQPYHPAVLRALARVAKAGSDAGIDVSICGEMGHGAAYIPFLLGIGIRTFSIDPQFLPEVQQQIMKMDLAEAKRHAASLLNMPSVSDVVAALGIVSHKPYAS